jgi:hypothetical protein
MLRLLIFLKDFDIVIFITITATGISSSRKRQAVSCYAEDGVHTFIRNTGSYKSHTALTLQKTAFFIDTAVKTSNLT